MIRDKIPRAAPKTRRAAANADAGFGVYEPFRSSDRERELLQVRVDVECVVDLCHRHFGPMCDRGRGAIIIIQHSP